MIDIREKGTSSAEVLESNCKVNECSVRLSRPVEAGAKLTLSITRSTLHNLRPLPSRIEQNGEQFLSFSCDKLIALQYPIQKQKTKIKVPSSRGADYTKGADVQGNFISYGPYSSESATENGGKIDLRFENTIPLPLVTYLERDIEVSHLGGNIAFEDRYALTNMAAHLADPFDRIAFAQSGFYNPKSFAIKSLSINLPSGTRTPYFTDEIGNVSTSRFRRTQRGAHLEVKPRYPIFGGWNYTFTMGYNNKLGKFLSRQDTRFTLLVPLIEGPEDITYDDIRVRVVLPEGAKNVNVKTPLRNAKISDGLLHTFMDTLGRTVVLIEATNLDDEAVRRPMTISYDYTDFDLLRKPSVVALATAFVLISSIGISKLF